VPVQITGYHDQGAAAPVVRVGHVEQPSLDQPFPILFEAEIRAQHIQVGRVVEELGIFAIEAHLPDAVRVLAADGPTRVEVVRQIERGDLALLDELGGRAPQRELIRRRHVVEVRVFDQRVQVIVTDGAIREAQHALGIAAVEELSEGAHALGVVELAEQARARIDLVLEVVPEEPRLARVEREIGLLGLVGAVLDAAGELERVETEADLDARGEAIGLGARHHVLQSAEVGARAEIQSFRGCKTKAGGMREAGSPVAVLLSFLEIHARAVREPHLDARDEVALAARCRVLAVVGALVLERIIHIHARAVRWHVARAEAAAFTEIAVRELRIDAQALGDAVGAAGAEARVLLAVAR